MDSIDEEFFQQLLKEKEQEKLQDDSEKIEEIFKKSLDDNLYGVYIPNTYERTYALMRSITTHLDIENNVLYVYPDVNEGLYQSAVTGEDVSSNVPDWVLVTGHHDDTNIQNAYHNYEEHYDVLEIAKQNIENELGYEVKIIDNENNEYEFFND